VSFKIKAVPIGILIMLPALLFSQNEGNRSIGGEFRLASLYYQKSALGVRKDIDLGFAFNYLKILSPLYHSDSIQVRDRHINTQSASSFGFGAFIGISGYYHNTDSIIQHGTNLFFGPVVRYYTSKILFLEGKCSMQYNAYKVEIADPTSGNYLYYPITKTIDLNLEMGVGAKIRLTNNVFFEPILSYQRSWENIYINQDGLLKSPNKRAHSIVLSMRFQFYY